MNSIIQKVMVEPLKKGEAFSIFWELLNDKFGEKNKIYLASFLTAMQARGPTVEEISGLMKAVNKDAKKLITKIKPVCGIVGNGRDDFKTINISTGASLICAASGLAIAKNGCRAESSKTGTTDVLEALGAKINCSPKKSLRSLEENKFALFDAEMYFPRMTRNYVGTVSWRNPLSAALAIASPIRFDSIIFGISDPNLIDDITPEILKKIGPRNTMIVCGKVGNGYIDELSTAGTSYLKKISNTPSKKEVIFPELLGIKKAKPWQLKQYETHKENAKALLRGISGRDKAICDCLCLNAGAALYISGLASDIKEGFEIAEQVVGDQTLKVLRKYVIATGGEPNWNGKGLLYSVN